MWLEAREREAKEDFSRGTLARHLADNFGNGLSSFFPLWLRNDNGLETSGERHETPPQPVSLPHGAISNVSVPAWKTCFITSWPCCMIPPTAKPTPERSAWNGRVSRSPAGLDGDALAKRRKPWPVLLRGGRELAALLDPDTPVPGVTTGTLRPDIATIAVPATVDGRNMTWRRLRADRRVGALRYRARRSCPAKDGLLNAITRRTNAPRWEMLPASLGQTTFDIYLNGNAYWRNVPLRSGATS